MGDAGGGGRDRAATVANRDGHAGNLEKVPPFLKEKPSSCALFSVSATKSKEKCSLHVT